MTRFRVAFVVALSLVVLALAAALSLLFDVRADANGREVTWLLPWSNAMDLDVLIQYRLPRVLAAAVVGAGLATAGCCFQAVLRNPLAEPYTLGISSGSALFAVVGIRFHLDAVLGSGAVGLCALVGALATVWIVWQLGKVADELPAATLLLAGVTMAMFCSAASMAIQYTADFAEIYRMLRWMMGGLETTSYAEVATTSVAVVIGVIVLCSFARPLNALSAGPFAAAAVGIAPKRTMTIVFFTSSLIVGATIALAGPIGFVGLFVPHALRPFVGPDHRGLLPASAVGGAALLVLCDALAREMLAPDQLPVGVVTALLGGPFFLYLLLREKAHGRFWGAGA